MKIYLNGIDTIDYVVTLLVAYQTRNVNNGRFFKCIKSNGELQIGIDKYSEVQCFSNDIEIDVYDSILGSGDKITLNPKYENVKWVIDGVTVEWVDLIEPKAKNPFTHEGDRIWDSVLNSSVTNKQKGLHVAQNYFSLSYNINRDKFNDVVKLSLIKDEKYEYTLKFDPHYEVFFSENFELIKND